MRPIRHFHTTLRRQPKHSTIGAKMDSNHQPNKQRERQTAIIDDTAAIALAEARYAGRRGGAKNNGSKGKGFNFLGKNAGVGKPALKSHTTGIRKPVPKPHGTGVGHSVPKPQGTGVEKPAPKPHGPGATKLKFRLRNETRGKGKHKVAGNGASEAAVDGKDGLRIPPTDRSGRARETVRNYTSMAREPNMENRRSEVQRYGGDAKMIDFEAATTPKQVLGLRTQGVETKSFGRGPKEANAAGAPALAHPRPGVERGGKQKQKTRPSCNFANTVPDQSTSETQNVQQTKRRRPESDLELLNSHNIKRTKTDYSPAGHNDNKSSARNFADTQEAPIHNLTSHTQTQLHTHHLAQDMSPLRKRPGQGRRSIPLYLAPKDEIQGLPERTNNDELNAKDGPKSSNQGYKAARSNDEDQSSRTCENAHFHHDKESHIPNTNAGATPSGYRRSNRNTDLFIPKSFNTTMGQPHPLTNALDLNPDWDPISADPQAKGTATRVLNLPGQRCHAIVTAESSSVVHITEIPYTRKVPVPQGGQPLPRDADTPSHQAAPYLKPGPHGYDYTNHRWHFGSDPDLRTGVGHQVEPDDEAAWESIVYRFGVQESLTRSKIPSKLQGLEYEIVRLSHEKPGSPDIEAVRKQKAEMEKQLEAEKKKLEELTRERFLFMNQYSKKYSGKTTALWPCGCQRVGCGAWEEGDSEAE